MTTKPKTTKPKTKPLILKKASDVNLSEAMHLKVLAYGKSGVGKTHFASQAENVAVCLVERQGFATISKNAPHAIIPSNQEEPEGGGEVIPYIDSMEGVRGFLKLAVRGEFKEAGITTLVFDSITEIQQLMMMEIQSGTVFTVSDWGRLGTMMRAFLRMVRDLPYHVIVLGLADWADGDDGRIMSPLVKGSISKDIAGYFNLVVYIYKRQDEDAEDGVQRYALADGDDRYTTKPYGGLTGVLTLDFDLWLQVSVDDEDKPLATIEGAPKPGTTIKGDRLRPKFGEDEEEDKD